MNYLCFGVGAIGTYIGGSLALSDENVVFLERPELVAEIQKYGLTLKNESGTHHLEKIQVVGSLEAALQLGPLDAAVFAVKSFDTPQAAAELTPFKKDLPPFLCLQNGVENEAVLSTALGPEKVIPATVTSAVGRLGAGSVVLERLRGVGISANHPLSQGLFTSFVRAGLRPRLFANPQAMKWSKMLTNLLANATSAILNLTPAEIFADRRLFSLEVGMLKEALGVMDKLELPVVALPGTPVDSLVWVVKHLPVSLSQPLLKRALGSGRGGKMPSFHIDLYAGRRRSEVEYLNGAVVRFGQKVNVATPINRVLTSTLISLADGTLRKEDFAGQPQKLFDLINAEEEKQL